MSRIAQRLVAASFFVSLAACSGGGCGGGMTPLPDGFPQEATVQNAAALRLTEPGFRFIEQNISTLASQLLDDSLGGSGEGGIITFEVPTSSGEQCLGGKVGSVCIGFNFKYEICPNGPKPDASPPECVAEIDLGNTDFTIAPTPPNDIRVLGDVKMRLRKLPLSTSVGSMTVVASGGGNNECGDGGPDDFTWADVPLSVEVALDTDTNPAHTSRFGYSKAQIKSFNLNQSRITDAVHICPDNFGTDILNFLKGFLGNSLLGGLTNSLTGSLDTALCVDADENANPVCPKGSQNVDGICRFGDKESDPCVSTLLGMDGHMDLGGLLSSVSPGTSGAVDLMFALGGPSPLANNPSAKNGDLQPAAGGATLRMMGGLLPSPQASCVPIANVTPPSDIVIPTEFSQTNRPADWPADYPGPHAGLLISERFLSYALANAHNSGFLCLGITTDAVDQLNSGLFSLLVPSLNTLTQKKNQQLALAVRPQKPPVVRFGNGTDLETDPNIRLELPELSIDFYVWSMDRFIRTFTATLDVDVPLNLDVSKDGLLPVLETINIKNAKVTNSDLLREDPAALASSLASIVSTFAGQLTGSLGDPIDLNDALSDLGLSVELPPSEEGKGTPALRKLEQNGESFLNLWLALGVAEPAEVSPMRITSQTDVSLTDKIVDPAGLRITTATDENMPIVRLRATSSLDDGSRRIEYSYRVNQGIWKPWREGRFLEVRDPVLRLQGKHTVEVASRVVGAPKSQGESARVSFTIDVDAPQIDVGRVHDGMLALDVWDRVSHQDDILVRYALDDGAFSSWMPASQLASIDVGTEARVIRVEAKDEEENVASTQQALIRGRKDPTLSDVDDGGCGCSVPGRSSDGHLGLAGLGVLALGIFLRGRKRQSKAETSPPSPPPTRRSSYARRALTTTAILAIAGSYAGCSCSGSSDAGEPVYDCNADPNCVQLQPGLIGAYTSAAVAGDGTVWVAGYNEADWDMEIVYGDLVVGTWDAASGKVAWQTVDGLPEGEDLADYYPGGFRGGVSQSGDDVGLWTSLAIDGNGLPQVAYYDVTNKALKLAAFDGTAWNVSFVEQKQGSDLGRYAKLVFLPNGNPAIAYLALEPGNDGYATSKVRVAIGKNAAPSGPSDWSFEDAAVHTTTPCRAALCRQGTACDAETGRCLETDKCDPKCSSGEACLKGPDGEEASCRDIFGNGKLDSYPEAHGLYVSLALTPKGELGLVYYDRIRGNLMQARRAGGSWETAILDGQSGTAPNEVDTGDVGIGASLFIDPKGDWHVSYADGNSEGLKYLLVKEGTTPQAPEVVDDGRGVSGTTFNDGQHIVGDDSHIIVTASGQIQISYQDATSGTLRWATGTPQSGGGHAWELRVIEQDGFAGAFSRQVVTSDGTRIANFWRKGGETVVGDVNLASP